MTKLDVYIDFEAISMPFSADAKIGKNFPFAYSIGIYRGKKMKIETFIFNFSTHDIQDVDRIMRNSITEKIRSILNNKSFIVNSQTVTFIGWTANLEKSLLNNIFHKATVKSFNANDERTLSLTRLTQEIPSNYFTTLKAAVASNLSEEFIRKRRLTEDGALAALAGYLLHSINSNKKGKYFFGIDTNILLKEINHYSRDDVRRIVFLKENPAKYEIRKKAAIELIKSKYELAKKISQSKKIVNMLEKNDPKETIETFLIRTKNEILELEEEFKKANEKFNNL